MKYLIYPILILYSVACLADGEVEYHLKKGDIAPIDGYLFTPAKEADLRLLDTQFTSLQNINKLQQQDITLMHDRITNYNTELKTISDRLASTKEDNLWGKIGMFVLGAGLASLVSYGVYKSK